MDTDLIKKTKKTCEKNSESLYMIANEPTLACFRIAEHVFKSGPHIQERGVEMKKLENQLKGACYDLDYTVKAIKSMENSRKHFNKMKDLLKDAFFYKQQIDYDNNVRYRVATRGNGQQKKPATQRFSGSFDIPSFLSSHLPSSPSTSMLSSSTLARSDSSSPSTNTKPSTLPSSSTKTDDNQQKSPDQSIDHQNTQS